MAARREQEKQARRRRKRLVRGLVLGAAAVGVPALANVLIARRNRRLTAPGWGRSHRYAWRFGEVAFQQLGQGPPVLLLHSLGPGHDSEQWRAAGEMLASRFEVFAPDLIGWGRSDKPPIEYDAELYIQLLADFTDDVIRRRTAMVAAGLSAAYAVEVALDRPESVSSLALVVPSGIELHGEEPDLKDALLNRVLRLPVLGASALNLYTSHASIARHLRRDTYVASDRVDAAHVEHHYQSSHQPGSHLALAAFLSGYLNHTSDDALPRLDTPVWLGWGRGATSPPVETADLWLQRLPGAELEVFEGSGNLPHLETPAGFCRKLEGFLAQHAAA